MKAIKSYYDKALKVAAVTEGNLKGTHVKITAEADYGCLHKTADLLDALRTEGILPAETANDDEWRECTLFEYDTAATLHHPRRTNYVGIFDENGKSGSRYSYFIKTPPAPQLPTTQGSLILVTEISGVKYDGDGDGWLLIRNGIEWYAVMGKIDNRRWFSNGEVTAWKPAKVVAA